MIQSAGLLNAALVRRPDNKEQIKQDLIELHQIVLNHAGADDCNANLEDKAALVKKRFDSLRSDICEDLKDVKQVVDINNVRAEMKKIEKMIKIQNRISEDYIAIMEDLTQHCETIMGNPPCKYALIGMGSLARKEITPYSDFEHAIVLDDNNFKENPDSLEYFRWFSVIFHVIVLNLQETIVPSLHIPVLNKSQQFGDWFFDDFTPSGISFDGTMPHACKFPLGRQSYTKEKQFKTELIKPVKEMLNYLSEEESLKNGYHLSDILSQTCYVSGDKTVYNLFADGVKEHYRNKSDVALEKEVKQQVEEDLNRFSIQRNFSKIKLSKINIKSNVYRALSLFISALRKFCKVSESSSFEVILGAFQAKFFSAYGSRKLRFALAIACEMRLRLCMKSGSQHGHVRTSKSESKKKDSTDFVDLVGKLSTLNLLQIAYCLQAKVADMINFEERDELLQVNLVNYSLGYKLDIPLVKLNEIKLFCNETDLVKKFDFDASLQQMEDATQAGNRRTTRANTHLSPLNMLTQAKQNVENLLKIAVNCVQSGFIEDAKKFFCFALEIIKKTPEEKDKTLNFAVCHFLIGLCWKELQNYKQSQKLLKKSLKVFSDRKQKLIKSVDVKFYAACAHQAIGHCWMEVEKPNYAGQSFKKALGIFKTLPTNKFIGNNSAVVLQSIGKCLLSQNKIVDAIDKFDDSRRMFETRSLDDEPNEGVASVLLDIGRCYLYLEQYDDALKNYKESLDIYHALDKIQDNESFANLLFNMAMCYMKKEHFQDAAKTFSEILESFEDVLDEDEELKTEIHGHVGSCYMQLKKYDESLKHFRKKLGYYESTSKNPVKDEAISDVLSDMACCCMEKKDYNQAKTYFERSLDIIDKTFTKKVMTESYADRHRRLGICLLHQNNYNASLQHLEKSRDIFVQLDSDFDIKKGLAEILVTISQCKLGLSKERKPESKLLLKEAFEIYSHLSADGKTDNEVYSGLNRMGIHLMEWGQFQEALNCFNKSKKVQLSVPNFSDTDSSYAQLLRNKGLCLMSLERHKEAVACFEKFLNNFYKSSIDKESTEAADANMELGVCFMNLEQNHKSITFLKKSLTIYQNHDNDESIKEKIVRNLISIGKCYMQLNQYQKSLKKFKEALAKCEDFAARNELQNIVWMNIGKCYFKSQK